MGGFGSTDGASAKKKEYAPHTEINVIDTANELITAKSIVIVPGFGMAQASCQSDVARLVAALRERKIKVEFSIHPVAGRLPGHMNVLLAEAKVPYNIVIESDKVNETIDDCDVAIVIGANDIVNPSRDEKGSALEGMPMCEVWRARRVIVNKRKMEGVGYSGVENPLFFEPHARMLLGDAGAKIKELADEVESRTAKKKKVEVKVDGALPKILTPEE